jgi:hypothetical protein
MRASVIGLAAALATLGGSASAEPPPSWQARFEREQPPIVRAIDGVPGPPGYERETHYDRRRMLLGSLGLGVGTGLQLLVVSSRGFEGRELIPCTGVFSGDYGKSSNDTGWVDTQELGRAFMALPICTLFLVGAIELGRGLASPRPVWVRSEARQSSLRIGGVVTGQEARIHAIGYF